MKRHHFRHERMYIVLTGAALMLALIGFCLDTPGNILRGLLDIAFRGDVLITDYMETAGIGAAFVNAALVTLVSIALLYLCGEAPNGYLLVTVGLMAAFAFFGKNIFNIWPLLGGTWLYARLKREPFSKYVSVGLLSTALSPLVSFVALEMDDELHLLGGAAIGVLIGFVMPPLAAYTFRIQNGMNLYNMGFAGGILAMAVVSVLAAVGRTPSPVLHWSTGHNSWLGVLLYSACVLLIISALVRDRSSWRQYIQLLGTSGRAPSDYLRAFGSSAVMINAGINGIIATTYILLTGGDLNGPTLGGILAVMSFSAWGKHARNIWPVMLGVLIGGAINHSNLGTTPSLQLAGLFCTTLAPVAGVFGWPAGILAGFLHSCVVLRAGLPLEGVNLYNNGFSGGVVAMVLYPLLTALICRRKPGFQEEDYFAVFQEDRPIRPEEMERDPDEEVN